jgi:hypothetical protein
MKAYGGMDVQIHIFVTSALAGKVLRYPLDRRLVGPRVSLDDVEKRKFLNLPGLELRPLGRSARSQSLYRLRYPGSLSV